MNKSSVQNFSIHCIFVLCVYLIHPAPVRSDISCCLNYLFWCHCYCLLIKSLQNGQSHGMNTNDYEKILAIQPMNVRLLFGKNKNMINNQSYEHYPKSGKIKMFTIFTYSYSKKDMMVILGACSWLILMF